MNERFLCIHGHFYQPPRENPWLEAVERQDSAYPYHDWNERVTSESYAPNAASRILDERGRIVRIVNNYARISFNFGPTLLAWMQHRQPDVYRSILEADEESRERFSGHGSALAQAYNHMILPLASPRDQRTQVHWGMEDFRRRFRREPEGMWLPETAVDTASLEALAELGIAFTILAPRQIEAVRAPGEKEWTEVDEGSLATTRPYRVALPSGREIAVFVYNGRLSRAVAFERLLTSGDVFAARLTGAFPEDADDAPLVHIATDGETYGHHHRHGEMALSYALRSIEERADVRLTNYGEYLALHPPEWEARIAEDTSWSCAHGVERWRSDCGCSAGRGQDWNQAWREPLRDALDWLREEVDPLYETEAGKLLIDPWKARDRYVELILDRSRENVDRFFGEHDRQSLSESDRVRALELLELQRHAMLMYTSCGWFFDEVSGIETVQVLEYAGRVVHLADELFNRGLERRFLSRLGGVPSNLPEWEDAAEIYRAQVEPARVDLRKVGAHFAVSSLFEEYSDRSRIYCFTVERHDQHTTTTGRSRLSAGRLRVVSEITGEASALTYGVLHMGDHNIAGGAREFRGTEAYHQLVEELTEHFGRADFPAVLRVLDHHFQSARYSLRSLFRDEQRRILAHILESSLEETEQLYAQIYEDRAPLMRFVAGLGIPQPRPFRLAAEYALTARLKHAWDRVDLEEIRSVLDEALRSNIHLEEAAVGFAAQKALERMTRAAAETPEDAELLGTLLEMTEVVRRLPFEVTLWGVQNVFYEMLQDVYPEMSARAERGEEPARIWVAHFRSLGERIQVAVETGTPVA